MIILLTTYVHKYRGQGQGQIYSELNNDHPGVGGQGTMSCLSRSRSVKRARKNRYSRKFLKEGHTTYKVRSFVGAQRLINLEIPVLVRSLKSSNVELGYPSKFFLALQSFCCRLSINLLSYDSRSTLIRLERTIFFGRVVLGWTTVQVLPECCC